MPKSPGLSDTIPNDAPLRLAAAAAPNDNVSPAPGACALFVQDRELHRRVCLALGWDRFRAALKAWERGRP
jgi:hypothetical protein